VSNTAAGRFEDVDVLFGRVGHGDTGPGEDPCQGCGIDGQRVDQGHLVRPAHLNEGQLRIVGALGVELGVECVMRLAGDLVAERVEVG
jgi:hypothetical protein